MIVYTDTCGWREWTVKNFKIFPFFPRVSPLGADKPFEKDPTENLQLKIITLFLQVLEGAWENFLKVNFPKEVSPNFYYSADFRLSTILIFLSFIVMNTETRRLKKTVRIKASR